LKKSTDTRQTLSDGVHDDETDAVESD
jgi:hypothetical protein